MQDINGKIMSANKIRYENLDKLKFIASILIIFIHVPFPENVGLFVKSFARIGVPIFFMISGFFSYNIITEKNPAKFKYRQERFIAFYIVL